MVTPEFTQSCSFVCTGWGRLAVRPSGRACLRAVRPQAGHPVRLGRLHRRRRRHGGGAQQGGPPRGEAHSRDGHRAGEEGGERERTIWLNKSIYKKERLL